MIRFSFEILTFFAAGFVAGNEYATKLLKHISWLAHWLIFSQP